MCTMKFIILFVFCKSRMDVKDMTVEDVLERLERQVNHLEQIRTEQVSRSMKVSGNIILYLNYECCFNSTSAYTTAFSSRMEFREDEVMLAEG